MIFDIISWVFSFGVVWPWALYSISSNIQDVKDINAENKRILKAINDIENYKLNVECEILANDERIHLLKEGY